MIALHWPVIREVLLYLLPSAALAVLIAILARLHPLFFIFTAAGTLCHELAHWLVGFLVGARPVALSIIPRRTKAGAGRTHAWQLGAVTLMRVRWYNAAPAALAPLLIVLLPFAVAWWRTRGDWHLFWSGRPVDRAGAGAAVPVLLAVAGRLAHRRPLLALSFDYRCSRRGVAALASRCGRLRAKVNSAPRLPLISA